MCVEGEVKVKFCVEEKKGEYASVRINDDIQIINQLQRMTTILDKSNIGLHIITIDNCIRIYRIL